MDEQLQAIMKKIARMTDSEKEEMIGNMYEVSVKEADLSVEIKKQMSQRDFLELYYDEEEF